MRFPKRDFIATGFVAIAVVLYLLWLADAAFAGMSGVRVTGAVLLGLGFAASAVAVVPNFDQLIHGNKVYLAITSLLGLVAVAGGVHMLVWASDAGIAVLMGTMVVLWAIATTHHMLLAKAEQSGVHLDANQPTRREHERVG